jgi:FMN-dependent NADH-azoreductase
MENNGIKISPKFYQKDWLDLDLSKNSKENWDKAIEIFKDRIEGRYFKQIQALDNNQDISIRLFSGFAIMSLTCLLVETLEQFWTGNITTSRKNKQNTKSKKSFFSLFSSKKETFISNDAIVFHTFFQRSSELKNFFDTVEKSNVFYTKIRCGLLHQGQTKGKSLIHIKKNEPMLKWINENNIEEGISIHRRLFVKEIYKIYEIYIDELKKPNNQNFRRKTLGKKMKYIAELK